MLLAIDTSTVQCAVAVGDGASLYSEQAEDIGRGHAERLMPMIEAVLNQANIDFDRLTAIGTTIGPGSFTGVRVGLSAARGLALALNIPCYGISVLKALAATGHTNEPCLALIDAKRGETYAQLFVKSEQGIDEISAPFILAKTEDVPDSWKKLNSIQLVGSPTEEAHSILRQSGLMLGQFEEKTKPPIKTIFNLTMHEWALNPESEERPSPLYLRGPDAKPQQSGILPRVSQ